MCVAGVERVRERRARRTVLYVERLAVLGAARVLDRDQVDPSEELRHQTHDRDAPRAGLPARATRAMDVRGGGHEDL